MEEKNQKLNSSLKLMASASLVVFLGLLLSKLLTYLSRIIIARYFGAEIYGIISLATMVTGLGIAIFSFGLPEGLVRFIAYYRGKKDKTSIQYLVKNTLYLLLISGIAGMIIVFFLSRPLASAFNNNSMNLFLKALSVLIPLTIIGNMFLAVIRAYEKIKWYSFLTNILGNVVRVALLVFLLYISFGVNALLISYIAGAVSIVLTAYAVCKFKIPEIFGQNNPEQNQKTKIRKELHTYSWPLMFFAFLSTIFYWIDSFTIGYFKGVEAVGVYNAALPLAFFLNFAPEIFLQLFFPLISREYSKKNLTLIKELSKQVGKWIFIVNIPILVITLFFPGALINIFFGEEYLPAANALRILSIGTFVFSIFLVSNNLLSMAGKSEIILKNIIGVSFINFLLNILLIPRNGIDGAAVATSISLIILSFLLMIEASHYTGIIPLRRKLAKILLISLIPTLLLLILKQLIPVNFTAIVLEGLLFILLYILLVIITGCLDQNDFIALSALRPATKKITPD